MSAIAGIYHPQGQPVERAALEEMVARGAHRGPDGVGQWSEGCIGLGHRMLWTTPESLGEGLPLADLKAQLVLTADARIDNREELLRELELPGPPAQIADSQLILAAYQKWGQAAPGRLLGDFAFAIWDGRRQTLFCARDPMGAKSLYYHYSGKEFAFATEIKALLCLPEVPRRLNEVKVADYLAQNYEDRAITFYQGILRLPAAHSLTVDRRGLRCQAYWSLDPARRVRLGSDGEYAEAFRAIFSEAVRCRLRSAFPVGAALSGGLDSSSIVCTARQLPGAEGGKGLHAFSAIFPGLPEEDLPKIDERRYVDAVAALGGFASHCIRADRLSPLAELDRVLWHQDEACCAPNLYLHWALYRAAHQYQARVFLDGIDGDTTVSHGWGYLAELARTGRWNTLLREATALGQRLGVRPWRLIWQFGLRPLVPGPAAQLWRRARGDRRPAWEEALIHPDFAQRLGLTERLAQAQKNNAPARTAAEDHRAGLSSPLYPYALELADKAAAAFSLEPRYPFFDRRLMEFCLALPPEQKLHQGWTRLVMRRAMEGVLPPQVQWRPGKSNLSPNFKRRLLDQEREVVEAVIHQDSQILERYVDLPALRAAYQRYLHRPMQSEREAVAIFGIVVLARWLRRSGLGA